MENINLFEFNNDSFVRLRNALINFVTSHIIDEEKKYYDTIMAVSPDSLEHIMCSENNIARQFIKTSTEQFYNTLFNEARSGIDSSAAHIVLGLSTEHNISVYAVCHSLFKIKFKCHMSIPRKTLSVVDTDSLEKTLINQINIYFQNDKHVLENICTFSDEPVNIDNPFKIIAS